MRVVKFWPFWLILVIGLVVTSVAFARIDLMEVHHRAIGRTFEVCKSERHALENGVVYAECDPNSVRVLEYYYTNKKGTSAAAETTFTIRKGSVFGGAPLWYALMTIHYEEMKNGNFRRVSEDFDALPIPKNSR